MYNFSIFKNLRLSFIEKTRYYVTKKKKNLLHPRYCKNKLFNLYFTPFKIFGSKKLLELLKLLFKIVSGSTESTRDSVATGKEN